MKVLITGAGGGLGRELVATFAAEDVVAVDRAALDVGKRELVTGVMDQVRPDVVIHAAAFTDVDGCETQPDKAWLVNALGTRYIAQAAARVRAWVCYVSTDYVFDGRAGRPYVEWDLPNPLSVYGRSKLGGETELGPYATVVRTSWVAGRHGRNFVKSILRRASEVDKLKVVDDQRGSPTFTEDLAVMIHRLVMNRMPGRYHVTNQGVTSWYGLARAVLAAAGLEPDRVEPISTSALNPPRPAPRPAYSALDNAALRLSGVGLLDDYHAPLERLVKELTAS